MNLYPTHARSHLHAGRGPRYLLLNVVLNAYYTNALFSHGSHRPVVCRKLSVLAAANLLHHRVDRITVLHVQLLG